MRYISIDTEFRKVQDDKRYQVICICTYEKKTNEYKQFWTFNNPSEVKRFNAWFTEIKDHTIWFTHWAYAEIYSLLSLGINTDGMQCIDTFIEAKLVQNTGDKRKVKYLSLSDLCDQYEIFNYHYYKGIHAYKDKMRKKILFNETFSKEDKDEILHYCSKDAENGYKVAIKLGKEYQKIFEQSYDIETAITRGNAVKSMTVASWVGIPIDTEFLSKIRKNYYNIIQNFIENAHPLVQKCYVQKGLKYSFKYKQFEQIVCDLGLDRRWKRTDTGNFSTKAEELKEMRYWHEFVESLYKTIQNIKHLKYLSPNEIAECANDIKKRKLTKENLFKNPELFNVKKLTLNKKAILQFIENKGLEWDVYTESGKPSVTFDTVLSFCNKHNFNDIIDDIHYYKAYSLIQKQKEDLQIEDTDKPEEDETIYNILTNGWLHIPYNPFGTITARNSPRAKLFIFAQCSWQRSLVRIPEGYKLVALDYSGAEIFLGAHIFKDKAMLESYFSKDYYLATGVNMKVVDREDFVKLDKDSLKEKYKSKRNMLKQLTLGKNYGAGIKAISRMLFPQEKEKKAIFKTKKLVNKYERSYKSFFSNKQDFVKYCSKTPFLRWHWGFKAITSETTAGNWNIQTSNAMALHKTFIRTSTLANHRRGLYVFSCLHDGLYALIKDDEHYKDNLNSMIQVMKETVDQVVENKDGRQIKIGYVEYNAGETFYEKDLDTIKNVAQLVGHELSVKNIEEKEV